MEKSPSARKNNVKLTENTQPKILWQTWIYTYVYSRQGFAREAQQLYNQKKNRTAVTAHSVAMKGEKNIQRAIEQILSSYLPSENWKPLN